MKIKKIFLLTISCLLLNILLTNSVSSGVVKMGKEEAESLRKERMKYVKEARESVPLDIKIGEERMKRDKTASLPFGDMLRFALDDPRVYEYCKKVAKESKNGDSIRYAIYGLGLIVEKSKDEGKKKEVIEILLKGLKSEYLKVKYECANTLYKWGYKKEVFSTYVDILKTPNLDYRLDVEYLGSEEKAKEVRKHIPDTEDSKLADQNRWTFKAGMVLAPLERLMEYSRDKYIPIIKEIYKEGQIVSILEKAIKAQVQKNRRYYKKSLQKSLKQLKQIVKKENK